MEIEKKLKSGEILKILDTDFETSNALFKAVIKSLKSIDIDDSVKNLEAFTGALIGAQLSDDSVEKAMWGCLACCLYKGAKIVPSVFNDFKAREDFIEICLEVGQENLRPFMNGLYVGLPRITQMIANIQRPK